MAHIIISSHEVNIVNHANAHIEGEKPENRSGRMVVHESHAPTQQKEHNGQSSVFDGNKFGLNRALAMAAIRISRVKAIVVVGHFLEYV